MQQQAIQQQATGPFDVKRTGMDTLDAGHGAAFGHVRFEKRFHGDLDANSVVEMLAAGDPQSGSAGYVALEHVAGTLHGRRGRFMLQHSGTLDRGTSSLTVSVVPGSGSDELQGLHGNLRIVIAADGAHSYVFDYAID
jgi:hypothetical protein